MNLSYTKKRALEVLENHMKYKTIELKSTCILNTNGMDCAMMNIDCNSIPVINSSLYSMHFQCMVGLNVSQEHTDL